MPSRHKRGPDVLELMRAIWALDHALQSRSKAMARSLGVTGPQRFVLRVLHGHPGMSPGELADYLHLHPSTLTGVLKRLQARGLLERRADPKDARRGLLALTVKGRAVLDKKKSTVEWVVRQALERENPAKVASAQAVLQRLTSTLEDAPAP